MSSISGVYKITLVKDGRIYIGSAADIHLRWKWHKKSQVQLIGKMIKKYGADAFSFEVVEEVEPVKKILEEREQFYLDTLQPFPWNNNSGFNLSPTAYSSLGIKRSDETIKKMKDSWHNTRGELYFKKLSENVKGDKNPAKRPEVRKKISDSMKGKTWKDDQDRVQKHISARKGKKYSDEARENMKAAQKKNNKRSDEAKEKFYLAQRKLYEITKPDGEVFEIYSRELKIFCKENKLTYANLVTTAKTLKKYKGGWSARLLEYPAHHGVNFQ
jgi:group I intron endonuclease